MNIYGGLAFDPKLGPDFLVWLLCMKLATTYRRSAARITT